MSYTPRRERALVVQLPVAPAVPPVAVVPERLARAPGLHLWPRLRLPAGAVVVYVLTVLRPPSYPGGPVTAEAVYVGRTTDLARRVEYHRARSGRGGRNARNRQGVLPAFDDVLYLIEEAERAAVLESALVKHLLPLGNTAHKTGTLTAAERQALRRWGMEP